MASTTMTANHIGDSALILMCKRPRPGIGKQRVASTHGSDFAYRLARYLLDCAIEDLTAWPGPSVIAVADADDTDWARDLAKNAKTVLQGSGNLGARIASVTSALKTTTRQQIFIGIDAPTLQLADIVAAANALTTSDIVLADAEDGGVVLMGCRKGWPALEPLPWSSSSLGSALEHACRDANLDVHKLPSSHADIDYASQLAHLTGLLQNDARPARQKLKNWLTGPLLPTPEQRSIPSNG